MGKKKKILIVGGGTGISTVLRGLKKYDTVEVVAVVTMMDDGGSSGRLRKEFGSLPPGDIRNCLLSLASKEDILTKIFDYRFPITQKRPQVGGHSLGNLLMLALADIYGGFDKAIRKISEILAIKGKVLPITVEPARLIALHENGSKSFGETKISSSKVPIKKLMIDNKNIKHYPEVTEEIYSCDLLVIGPGSLFTSLLPNLLIKNVNEAISRSGCKKAFICNIMTQPGETDNYSVVSHLKKIYEHCEYGFIFDYIIINTGKIPKKILEKYAKENSYPVKVDDEEVIKKLVKNIIKGSFYKVVKENGKFVIRHDYDKISKILLKLLWM